MAARKPAPSVIGLSRAAAWANGNSILFPGAADGAEKATAGSTVEVQAARGGIGRRPSVSEMIRDRETVHQPPSPPDASQTATHRSLDSALVTTSMQASLNEVAASEPDDDDDEDFGSFDGSGFGSDNSGEEEEEDDACACEAQDASVHRNVNAAGTCQAKLKNGTLPPAVEVIEAMPELVAEKIAKIKAQAPGIAAAYQYTIDHGGELPVNVKTAMIEESLEAVATKWAAMAT